MSRKVGERGKGRRPAVRAGSGAETPRGSRNAESRREVAEVASGSVVRDAEDPPHVAPPERRVAARAARAKPRARSQAPTSAANLPPILKTPPGAPAEAGTRATSKPDLEALLREAESLAASASMLEAPAGSVAQPALPVTAEADVLRAGATQWRSSDYYLKQWGRLETPRGAEPVDDFGLDPAYEARVQPWLDLLYERYFRVKLDGAERLPTRGAALLVCNHAGSLPWDGVMLKTALRHARPGQPGLRWLTDDYVFHSPFLGACLNRMGAVRACPENADRLLSRGDVLAVFPEGIKGIGKLYRERYQLQRFGRGGHVKLALRMGVPLIPLAIVGSEESYPLVYKLRAFSKALGMPFIPVTPLFPWLGPLGLLPLPSRWQIVVGEPMRELDGLPPSAADDSVLVNELNEQLRAKVQVLLRSALDTRGPAF